MSAPQIEDAPDLGSIAPPETIRQVGPAEPYSPAQRWATVTALPSREDIGPIEPVTDPVSEDESGADAVASVGQDPAPSPLTVRLEATAPPPAPTVVRLAPVQSVRPAAPPPRTGPARVAAPSIPEAAPTPSLRKHAEVPGFWSRIGEVVRGLFGLDGRGTGDEYVPGTAVLVLGVLALGVATAAFTLSFQMILPVVTAAGWTPPVSYLGPVVIDIAAVAAAFMGVLSAHPAFSRTGRQLLIMATILSIVLNLAGHQVMASAGGAVRSTVPPGWSWTVELFSVMVPVILAISIHVFGVAFSAWLAQRSRVKKTQQRRQNSGVKSTSAALAPASSSPAPPPSSTQSPEDRLLAEIVDYALSEGCGYRKALRAFADRDDLPPEGLPPEGRVKRALAEARKPKPAAS